MIPLLAKLEMLREEASREIKRISSVADTAAFRIKYLGRKGEITACLRELPSVPIELRPQVGAKANSLKLELENAIDEKQKAFAP